MNLCVLFWFYKDVDVCRNRLQILRRHNPDISIFGLFGGDASEAPLFESRLKPYLDDFFVFPAGKSAKWKWYNGDLMIADWYDQRGRFLSWDTIVVVQWDMLLFGRLTEIFAQLNKNEILLSSTRSVEEVTPWWRWTKPSEPRYREFAEHIREKFDYHESPVCCQFVIVCFPREFLERYAAARPENGFIEYRVPTFARIFGVPFNRAKQFDCWWSDEPATAGASENDLCLTAAPIEMPASRVRAQLARPDGARVFHPFNRMFPIDASSFIVFMWDSFKDVLRPTPFGRLGMQAARRLRRR